MIKGTLQEWTEWAEDIDNGELENRQFDTILMSVDELRKRFAFLKESSRLNNDFQSILDTEIIESAILDEDEDFFKNKESISK